MAYAEDFSSTAGDAGGGGGGGNTVDNEYFDSYGSDFEVHRVMLGDQPRMRFYRDFLFNSGCVKNKIVIEVGAGTGVLSCWAAKGGAKHVISIEASDFARSVLKGVIADNKLQDKISIVAAKAEELKSTEDLFSQASGLSSSSSSATRDDIILISEWMGFYLLHEGMLNSVLYVRDLLLQTHRNKKESSKVIEGAPSSEGPTLTMYPSEAEIVAAPISLAPFIQKKFFSFWTSSTAADSAIRENSGYLSDNQTKQQNSPEMIDMSAVGRAEAAQYLTRAPNPMIEVLPKECLLSDGEVVSNLDLTTVTADDLKLIEVMQAFPFNRVNGRDISNNTLKLDGFTIWFTVSHTEEGEGQEVDGSKQRRWVLDTSPECPPTHWKQSTVLLPAEMRISSSGGTADDETGGDGSGGIDASSLVQDLGVGDAQMGIHMVLTQADTDIGARCYEIELDLYDPSDEGDE